MRDALVVLCILVLVSTSTSIYAKPDFTGLWWIVDYKSELKPMDGSPVPLTPAAKIVYEERLRAAARGDRSFDGTTFCLPPGLPRLMLINRPFEILHRDKTIYFVHELNRLPRRAYFDEELPVEPDPLYLGYSVAHWEDDDTLVINSAGFRDSTLLDDSGLPHSERLRLTERFRLDDDGSTLRVRFTIHDPQIFTQSWDAQVSYVKRSDYEIPEDVCSDTLSSAESKSD